MKRARFNKKFLALLEKRVKEADAYINQISSTGFGADFVTIFGRRSNEWYGFRPNRVTNNSMLIKLSKI